ncbi:hypothetical protein [Bdellovibrio bacteriovorus]|uniref:hypothetical protein n=1 Tax=Bdellovibrio bacteriovorus TaxID=959 RepID=UPI0035A71957
MKLWSSLVLATTLTLSSLAQAEDFWVYQNFYAEEAPDMFSVSARYAHVLAKPDQLGGVIRIQFEDGRDVPHMFRQFLPGENFDRPRGISVYLAVTNDYNVLNPIAVGADTDDHGYTHGAKIAIGGFLPSGHYLTFDYSTDLFTKPVDGTTRQLEDGGRHMDQYFTNETVLKFVLDNIDNARSKTFYWKAETGWQQLKSDSRGGFFHGATHQEKFHELVNSMKPGQTKTPHNISDGEKTRNGVILGLYVGIAKEYINARNTCRARAFSELGSRGSTIDGASFVAANVGGVLWCQKGPRTLTYRAEVGHESKGHQKGYQGTGYADFSTGKGNWRIGFRIEQSHGNLINYVNYNNKNYDNGKIDTIFMIYYRHFFR